METLTLYQLNHEVRSLLEGALAQTYWVEAELSEVRTGQGGHCYLEFIQKDDAGRALVARARGTIWARTYSMLSPLFERATGERLRAGMKVRVEVEVEFHELYGYALNVLDIDPAYTLGDMAARRREILSQLEADGILHDNQQLPLPRLMQRIAVVSSAGAAGYGDFCNQLMHNEYGLHFDMRLFPAVMQGTNVEATVLAALEAVMAEAERWDCVVLIRGGGATSDLSDFDTYALAAAVAQMPIPVIVGIGHERDETVLDFVAHTRVKTPTAAAAFLIDHQAQELALLQQLETLFPKAYRLIRERQQHRLDTLTAHLTTAPQRRLDAEGHHGEHLHVRFRTAVTQYLERSRFALRLMEQRLQALDPVRLLKRGYSLTFTADGTLVRCVSDAPAGTVLTTQLAEGKVQSVVSTDIIIEQQ